jgi:hypothetical protein
MSLAIAEAIFFSPLALVGLEEMMLQTMNSVEVVEAVSASCFLNE